MMTKLNGTVLRRYLLIRGKTSELYLLVFFLCSRDFFSQALMIRLLADVALICVF